MGIIVTPPGRRNRQAETASQSAQRLRGLGMPETRGKNARGQNVRNEHAVPAISETTSISEISAAAETSTAIATTEQSPEPAKPTLRDLAGVKPSDKPTEQDRPKRDRPRLVFQPIHAVIAILTLSCALRKPDHAHPTGRPLQCAPTIADHPIRTIEGERNRERQDGVHANNTKPAAIHGTRQPERTNIRTSGARRSG